MWLNWPAGPEALQRVAAAVGHIEAPGGKSDLAYHALAIVVGTLVGLISIKLGGIPVTLGVGGGVLVSGLCFGWLHTRFRFSARCRRRRNGFSPSSA